MREFTILMHPDSKLFDQRWIRLDGRLIRIFRALDSRFDPTDRDILGPQKVQFHAMDRGIGQINL